MSAQLCLVLLVLAQLEPSARPGAVELDLWTSQEGQEGFSGPKTAVLGTSLERPAGTRDTGKGCIAKQGGWRWILEPGGWVQIPAGTHPSCVLFSQTFNLSVPHFPVLQ